MKKAIVAMFALAWAGVCLAQANADPKVAALTKKLDSIIIPNVQFVQADVAEVVQLLQSASKSNDVDKLGVKITLKDPENQAKVNLTLEKTSLHNILKRVGEMTGLAVDVGDDGVVLQKPKEEQK